MGSPEVPASIAEILDPNVVALIIWDMQVGVATSAHNSAAMQVPLQALLAAARARGVQVIWSQHVWPAMEHMAPPTLRTLMRNQGVRDPAALKPMYQQGTEEVDFIPGLTPLPGELVLEKMTISFFIGTPLEQLLRVHGIRTVVLTGVATEAGIEFTARHANALGYFVVVAEDAVGGRTPEGHATALERMRSFADVLRSTEIIATWSR